MKLTILIFGLIGMSLLIGCEDKIEPGQTDSKKTPTLQAPVAEVSVSRQSSNYEAVGTVAAYASSTVSSKLMGIIKEIHVREGDRVRKGDLLVVIDQSQVQAQLQQAQAALEEARKGRLAAVSARDSAQAGADFARSTYERYQQLMKEASTSRQEFEEVRARYLQSQAALSQAEAALEAAFSRVNQAQAAALSAGIVRGDSLVTAPFDGTVAAKLSDVGSMAAPGKPLLTLEGTEGYRIDLVLPERLIRHVVFGQKVKSIISAVGDASFEGAVETIVPSADEKSRTFLVKVRLPRSESIHSGMFARVMIPMEEVGILKIPNSAVVAQGQLTGVYLVDKDRRARFRLIRTGRPMGDEVEILTGLKEGDRYIVKPTAQIVNGARIEAVE